MFFLKELPTKAMLDKYTSDLTSNEQKSITEALSIMRQASLLVRNIETYFSIHDLSQLRFLILIVIDRE
ncbi:MAG: MarR family transcriptional regulator, partial [Gammaproteobacteria bacterium MedPE]